jgi:hypothetical protein
MRPTPAGLTQIARTLASSAQGLIRRAAAADSQALLLPLAGICLAGVGLIAWGGRRVRVEYEPHSGRAGDYRWLSLSPSRAARISAWAGYAAHQLAIWGCIYVAQRRQPAYSKRLRPLNWLALGINAGGVALHYAQTRRYYDGIAQDVPEGSALGSVAFMLMLILILETPRRGLAFGYGRRALPAELVELVRRYHGYIFSWSIIYTFWYHPMEGRAHFLIGFYHALLLFVQSSLMYTRAHLDRRWTVALELVVLPHAVTTAILNRNRLVPMFLFGFGGMALIAQMPSFAPSRRARLAVYAAYLAAAVAAYGRRGSLRRIHEIFHVAILEYGIVGALALLALLLRQIRRILPD